MTAVEEIILEVENTDDQDLRKVGMIIVAAGIRADPEAEIVVITPAVGDHPEAAADPEAEPDMPAAEVDIKYTLSNFCQFVTCSLLLFEIIMTTYKKYIRNSKAIQPPSFNVPALAYILENDNHERRKAFKEFAKDPIFVPRFDIRYIQISARLVK